MAASPVLALMRMGTANEAAHDGEGGAKKKKKKKREHFGNLPFCG